MVIFESEAETLILGRPVVRLFRTAFARDPDPAELADGVARLRGGADPAELTEILAARPGFVERHGAAAEADAAFVRRLCADLFGPDRVAAGCPEITRLAAIAGAGMSRAECVAFLANSRAGRDAIPVLPGIVPGAAPDDPLAYRLWVETYDRPAPAALAATRALLPSVAGTRVTIAMLAGDTTAEGARHSIESLRRQIYPDWELRLVLRRLANWPRRMLEKVAGEEPRMVLIEADPPDAPRASLLNAALAQAEGWAGLLAPGDRLAPTALLETMQAAAAHPEVSLIYTDEDRLDGETRIAPRFKPRVTPEAMRAGDALGGLALYRTGFLARLGGLRTDATPHEEYDLATRAVTALEVSIRHVPAILCHRAGLAADWPADWSVSRGSPAHASLPLPSVTVIVPTRDHAALLAACAEGVLERTDYPDLELLIIDNGSTEAAALQTLDRLAGDERVRVMRSDAPFNFAALNNAAAVQAHGDILLLLNDDTQVLEPGWLAEMAVLAAREDVGCVGARLLDPAGRIQHAGILLGPAGAVVHVGRGTRPDDPGYQGQLAVRRELSAVTAACLAIRRAVWRQVGGMDERLAVTFNDIDLCLRVRAAGLRVLWTPHATLLHREGSTRGSDAATAERQARFEAERALARATWGEAMECDPFLNPNLVATEAGPLALTRPRRRRPWDPT